MDGSIIFIFFPTGNTYEYVIEYLNSIPIVILLVETCIMAPFFEELLYRGIILNGLINRYSRKKAIIYSALIFGIAHLNFPQGINAFLLGLIIGTVYYYTRSIYLCMIMHFANNFLVNFCLLSNFTVMDKHLICITSYIRLSVNDLLI